LIDVKIVSATFGMGGGQLPPLPSPWLRAWMQMDSPIASRQEDSKPQADITLLRLTLQEPGVHSSTN